MSGSAPSDDLERAGIPYGGIPSAWGQAFPRSVRLAPDGFFVPSGTLRVLLRKSGRLEILYTGFAFEPWIRDAERVMLDSTRLPRRGDLALCEIGGWGDLRRILERATDGTWITGLDSLPGARERVPPDRVIAVVAALPGAGGAIGSAIATAFPVWSRLAAAIFWLHKTFEAPDFSDGAVVSVQRKYAAQVDSYAGMLHFPLGAELGDLLRDVFPGGGSILVAGSGAGGEAIHLARAGYRVTGLDVLEEMVRAARMNAAAAGVDIEFVQADMADFDLPGRMFDGIYVTPLVYSFVPGRERRVRSLCRLRRHLAPGASVVFSAHLIKSLAPFLQAVLTWARRRPWRPGFEFGDWFTWFLRRDGTIGTSFTHLFTASQVVAEARLAGFPSCRRQGAYFVATDLRRDPQAAFSSTAR